jgi:hypothetical protein
MVVLRVLGASWEEWMSWDSGLRDENYELIGGNDT